MTISPPGSGESGPLEPIVVVLPPLDLATHHRAIWRSVRPGRFQRLFLVVLAASLLALFVHEALSADPVRAAHGFLKIVLLASATLLVFEAIIVALWWFARSDFEPALLVAKEEGLLCRRHTVDVMPWARLVWWQATNTLLLLRVSNGALLVVPRRQGEDVAWERLRRVVAERVLHADRAESRIWILIFALFVLLVAIVVGLIARGPAGSDPRDSTNSSHPPAPIATITPASAAESSRSL